MALGASGGAFVVGKTFGERLAQVRLEYGQRLSSPHDPSFVEVARGLRVSAAAVGQWEDNKVDLPMSRLHQIADFYGARLGFLLEGELPMMRADGPVDAIEGVSQRSGIKHDVAVSEEIRREEGETDPKEAAEAGQSGPASVLSIGHRRGASAARGPESSGKTFSRLASKESVISPVLPAVVLLSTS